jgi:hypothetical protein
MVADLIIFDLAADPPVPQMLRQFRRLQGPFNARPDYFLTYFLIARGPTSAP